MEFITTTISDVNSCAVVAHSVGHFIGFIVGAGVALFVFSIPVIGIIGGFILMLTSSYTEAVRWHKKRISA